MNDELNQVIQRGDIDIPDLTKTIYGDAVDAYEQKLTFEVLQTG